MKNSKLKDKIFRYFKYVLVATIPCSILTINLVNAENAKFAEIKFIRGSKEIWIDSQGKRYPAQEGSKMQRIRDNLVVNGNAQTHAILKFFSGANKDLNMFVKTIPDKSSAVYKFPCQIQGGSFLFGWKLTQNKSLPCKEIKVQTGQPTQNSKKPNTQFLFAGVKQILLGQDWEIEYAYCSVVSDSGQSWLKIKTGDPCANIMEECEQTGATQCNLISMGDWWTTETRELTATIKCTNKEILMAKGSANQMKKIAEDLYQQAIASQFKGCSLQIYTTQDLVILPAQEKQISSLDEKTDEIIISVRDRAICPEVKVLWGAIIVKSLNNIEGVPVDQGMKTDINFCEKLGSELIPIDLNTERKSVDLEIIDAYDKGYEFCEQEQASGDSKGDTKVIQLTANNGNIKVEYDMYTIPDSLQIFYEGKEIYHTYDDRDHRARKVSGRKTVNVPFSGNSGRVEVVVTGNEDTGTRWKYTLSCPQ